MSLRHRCPQPTSSIVMSASPTNTNLPLSQDLAELRGKQGAGGHEALQALLAFSSLHEQIRRRRNQAVVESSRPDLWRTEQFVLDEVLQLVAKRAVALTGADGVAIALAEGDGIVCRASAGEMAPDPGARINPNSGFSGSCFRTGRIVRCDDTENDTRVNVQAANSLGVRSMVAVPLMGMQGPIGLLEAFSRDTYGFNDSDVRSLNLLAELMIAAMKPEDESRMAEISLRVQEEHAAPVAAQEGEDTRASSIDELRAQLPDRRSEALAREERIEAAVGQEAPTPAIEEGAAEPRRRFAWKLPLLLALAVVLLIVVLWWAFRATSPSPGEATPPATTAPGNGPAASGQISDAPPALPRPSTHSDGLTAVTGVRHWSSPNSTSVVVDLQDQVQYEAHRLSSPERIYFDLHDTTLAANLYGKNFDVGDAFLVRVRIAQPVQGVTRVVLETKGNPDFAVSLEQNPYRLLVEVRNPGAAAQPQAKIDLFAPTASMADTQQSARQTAPAVQLPTPRETVAVGSHALKFRIVLDAGHGGWDEGTIGRKGLMEKDLALDIVARLGKLIEQRLGGEIIYTRSDDTYVALEKRAEIANLAKADLFVSVHANYSDYPSARGVETYYTNTYSSTRARTDEADAAPAAQNISWTNVDIREKVLKSRQLAASVQSALYGRLSKENSEIRDRGIKKASYVVLTGTTMPAILAEVSFVSSPSDEKSLKSAAYRQRIAEALFKGIARYTADQQKVTLASASGKPSGR